MDSLRFALSSLERGEEEGYDALWRMVYEPEPPMRSAVALGLLHAHSKLQGVGC